MAKVTGFVYQVFTRSGLHRSSWTMNEREAVTLSAKSLAAKGNDALKIYNPQSFISAGSGRSLLWSAGTCAVGSADGGAVRLFWRREPDRTQRDLFRADLRGNPGEAAPLPVG